MFRPRVAILMACVVLIVLLAAPTLAQTSSGRIAGTVRDANGIPLAGAAVTITNQATGATRIVRSSETGASEGGGLPCTEARARPDGGHMVLHLLLTDRAEAPWCHVPGGRLSGGIVCVALPVHAGDGPVRYEPRRGAARAAGDPVRLRLRGRDG